MKLQRLVYGLSILFFFPALCLAHPHVFVDCTLTFVFDTNGLSGLKERWVFDEMFSSMILQDFDKDKNSLLNSQEIADIKKGAFLNLKNFNYFNHATINGENFPVKFVTEFFAEVRENHLIYTFFIPCHIAAASSYKEIKIAMYDSTYYVDVSLMNKPPVRFEDGDAMEYTYRIADNTQALYYYGQIAPQEIILNFRKKEEKDE